MRATIVLYVWLGLTTLSCTADKYAGGDSSGGGGVSVFSVRLAALDAAQTMQEQDSVVTAGELDPKSADLYLQHRMQFIEKLNQISSDPELEQIINDWIVEHDVRYWNEWIRNLTERRAFYYAITLAGKMALPLADAVTTDRIQQLPILLERYRPFARPIPSHIVRNEKCDRAPQLTSSGRKVLGWGRYIDLENSMAVQDQGLSTYTGDYKLNISASNYSFKRDSYRRNLNTYEYERLNWPQLFPSEFVWHPEAGDWKRDIRWFDYHRKLWLVIPDPENTNEYLLDVLTGEVKKLNTSPEDRVYGISADMQKEVHAVRGEEELRFLHVVDSKLESIPLPKGWGGFNILSYQIVSPSVSISTIAEPAMFHPRLPIVFIGLLDRVNSEFAIMVYNYETHVATSEISYSALVTVTKNGFLLKEGSEYWIYDATGERQRKLDVGNEKLVSLSAGPKEGQVTLLSSNSDFGTASIMDVESGKTIYRVKYESDVLSGSVGAFDTLEGYAITACFGNYWTVDFQGAKK